MKIQLERTLRTCPARLICIACRQPFEVGKIRTLLCNNEGLIEGDVCPDCLKSRASGIKPQVQVFAEDIKLPKFYHWWIKKLEILSQETQELENARLGISNCRCNRERLRLIFKEDKKTSQF